MERKAEVAERDIEKFYLYMENKIGNEYEGIVSSVTNIFYVELPDTIEGLVPIETLMIAITNLMKIHMN